MYLQPGLPEGLVRSESLTPPPPPPLPPLPSSPYSQHYVPPPNILLQPHINMKHVEHLKPSTAGAALIKNESLKCLRGTL